MIIEPADYNDLPAILALQQLCYQENGRRIDDMTIQPLTQTLAEIREEFSKLVFLKVILDNTIVGSIRAFQQENTCYIGKVIVHPDYQDRGIGKALMHALESRFPGARRFELFTGTLDVKNRYFYKKLGYTEFKEAQVSDRVVLVFLEKVRPAPKD